MKGLLTGLARLTPNKDEMEKEGAAETLRGYKAQPLGLPGPQGLASIMGTAIHPQTPVICGIAIGKPPCYA